MPAATASPPASRADATSIVPIVLGTNSARPVIAMANATATTRRTGACGSAERGVVVTVVFTHIRSVTLGVLT
jgi:hypothetical protein